MRPTVSVVTVVRNDVHGIRMTIESVINQTYSPIEYIVVDGASTDGTTEVIQQYAGRLTHLRERDRGISDALNKGAAASSGALIVFINSGDEFADERALERAMSAIPYGTDVDRTIFYADAVYDHPAGSTILPTDHTLLPKRNALCHQSVLVGAAVQRAHPYDERLRVFMDYDVWLRCLPATPFVKLPGVVGRFRSGGISGSDTRAIEVRVEEALVRMLNGHLAKNSRSLTALLAASARVSTKAWLRRRLGARRYVLLKGLIGRRTHVTWAEPDAQELEG